MPDTAATITAWQEHFESIIPAYLPPQSGTPAKLFAAMQYAVTAPAKRVRPLLVYASGQALNLEPASLDGIAVAIEFIHTYSLIHDDLPAMDDDDLRRGQPSCHRKFDEATAILAGDALQALAFEILAANPYLSRHPPAQVAIILGLARACGANGMAGGQVLDLECIGETLTQGELEDIHALKTGALIEISTTAAALIADADSARLEALSRFGKLTGLAFQVFDDLLDVTGDSDVIGKPSQSDAARLKPAFPSIIGARKSLERAYELRDEALKSLDTLPGNVDALAWLAGYSVDRDR